MDTWSEGIFAAPPPTFANDDYLLRVLLCKVPRSFSFRLTLNIYIGAMEALEVRGPFSGIESNRLGKFEAITVFNSK